MMDRGRDCPKHGEFYSKNKFVKLVGLVGFIVSIYHDAQSPEHQSAYQRLKYRWKVFVMDHLKLFNAK